MAKSKKKGGIAGDAMGIALAVGAAVIADKGNNAISKKKDGTARTGLLAPNSKIKNIVLVGLSIYGRNKTKGLIRDFATGTGVYFGFQLLQQFMPSTTVSGLNERPHQIAGNSRPQQIADVNAMREYAAQKRRQQELYEQYNQEDPIPEHQAMEDSYLDVV